MAQASAQVHGEGLLDCLQQLESFHVCLSKIVDVNIVADASAVRGRVVGSEDLQLRSSASGRSKSERDEVRLRLVQFADFSALVGSGRIEVTQAGRAQPVSTIIGFQRLLEEKLGDA